MIKRGYDKFLPGRKVLIVEDVLTTGGSVRKVIELAKNLKAHVAGVGALCNRGGITQESLQVPLFFPLLTVDLASWSAEECPLCKKGVPINTQVGKGKEFLASVRA
jgi:orotate phosphoribosyltransferase